MKLIVNSSFLMMLSTIDSKMPSICAIRLPGFGARPAPGKVLLPAATAHLCGIYTIKVSGCVFGVRNNGWQLPTQVVGRDEGWKSEKYLRYLGRWPL